MKGRGNAEKRVEDGKSGEKRGAVKYEKGAEGLKRNQEIPIKY